MAEPQEFIEEIVMVEQRLADLNLKSVFSPNRFFPSPIAWEDQAFYFLKLDRCRADLGASKVSVNVLALKVLTRGIPCIYDGSEQCFDGGVRSDRAYSRSPVWW